MAERRISSLGGLRGIAALCVIAHHFVCAYLPWLVPEQALTPWHGAYSPTALIYGGFSVTLFFVLSGFVIARSAARRTSPLVRTVVARYVRLAVPAVFGTLLSWLVLTLWPHMVALLKAAGDHPWLAAVYDGSVPPLWYALRDGAVGVFYHGGSQFNNALWTMRIELAGSMFVYVGYAMVRPSLRRTTAWALLGLLVAAGHCEYAAFAAGVLLHEFRGSRVLPRAVMWPMLAAALIVGTFLSHAGERLGWPAVPPTFELGTPHGLWHLAAATATVYTALYLAPVVRLLSAAPLRYLGEISFGLYLVHVPLIYTLFAPLGVSARGSAVASAGVFALLVAVATALAAAYTQFVDRPLTAALRSRPARRPEFVRRSMLPASAD